MNPHSFAQRHLGPNTEEISSMLNTLGAASLDEFVQKGLPPGIANVQNLNLPSSLTENQLIQLTRSKASKNQVFKNYIGQGFSECLPLNAANRNIIKNPCWYTAYTPYQAEIAQGRLTALLNFQTLICELTGMELANASLLDESSSAGEALSMAWNISPPANKKKIFIDNNIWPQTSAVLKTRADSLGLSLQQEPLLKESIDDSVYAVFFQYPSADGSIPSFHSIIKKLKEKKIIIIVSTDLLSNCLIQPPGEWGADIVIGSAGRFGLPLFYGGPHPAFLASKKEFSRNIPGRIVGVSKDRHGRSALRLSLQTREQHIRRERATSNICTSQVLPAVLASMYAVYHGPKGLKHIAQTIHQHTFYLYEKLKALEIPVLNTSFFDTLTIHTNTDQVQKIKTLTEEQKINLGYSKNHRIHISIGEGRTQEDMDELVSVFHQWKKNQNSKNLFYGKKTYSDLHWNSKNSIGLPSSLLRKTPFLKQTVFNQHHSETQLIRYIHHLQNKDLTLTHSMIPLGSCTMKLNATAELMPLTWKGFAEVHPFAPKNQVQGLLEIFQELEQFLCEITGFSAFSLQPNAGSQGEYAGLLVFKKYHLQKGESHRNICLIPESAHGTNPASAKMAGLKAVSVKCNAQGSVDQEDLKSKVQQHSKNLSCFMLTYPSTCGVFESHIPEICRLIHQHGGLVYFDGANMNALTGLCRPAELGVDAGHLNLHKTFCIPHGGGGPGAGPLGVTENLKPFLPSHPFFDPNSRFTLVSAPFGNAGILSTPWAYIRMMGFKGLKKASQTAILNANYIQKTLKPYYKILFTGLNQQVAHECLIDLRKFKYSADITVVDAAKRLMDYGFHAPTMSWPIPGTLMIEPTESEDKEEIDRFCSALISIKKEIEEIEKGQADKKNNLLKNAPHVLDDLMSEKWKYPYSKQRAFYPLPYLKEKKFWPSVSRVEEAYGDIHLFCCTPSPASSG